MALVFLSYSHKDEKRADRFQEAVESEGHEVWRDSRIQVGQSIPEGVASGLARCDYLTILVTKNSLASGWVKQELETRIMETSKRGTVIPLKFDETDVTQFSKLLRTVKYADFSKSFDSGIRQVLERLGPPSREDRIKKGDMKRRDFAIDVALRAGNVVMRYYNSCLIENMSIDDKKNTATLADRASQVEIESALKAHPDFRWEIIVAEEKPYDRHEVSPSGYTWVIDPLDGTTNFQNRIPFFCTAIGVLKDGHPHIGVIYDPTANKVYYAMEGDRTQVWSVSSGEVIHISTEKEITRLEDCLAGTHISSRPEIAKRLLQDDLLLDIAKNVKHLRAFGCGQLALAYTASGRLQLFFQFGPHLWDQVAGIVLVQNAGGIVSQLPSGGDWDYSARDIAASANEDLHRDFLDLLKHRS